MRLLQLGQQTRLVPHGATSYIASADSHAWLATFGSAILLLNTQHWIECLRILRPVIFVELPKSLKSWDGKSPLVHPPGMRPWGEADGILVHLRPWLVLCLPSLSWRTCRCHRTLARKPGDCAKGDSKPGEPRDRAQASGKAWRCRAHQGHWGHRDKVESQESEDHPIHREWGQVGRCQCER